MTFEIFGGKCLAIKHNLNVVRIYVFFFNSKCKILGIPFSWSFMKLKLWLKLSCGYKRNYRFLMKSSPRYFHAYLTHLCYSFLSFCPFPLELTNLAFLFSLALHLSCMHTLLCIWNPEISFLTSLS